MAEDSVYGADSRIQKYTEEKDKKYIFAVSGGEYVWVGCRQYPVKKIKQSLDGDKWVKISTGSGRKDEIVFEWRYVEVNCNVKGDKKYLIFRRNISEKLEIQGISHMGTMKQKLRNL